MARNNAYQTSKQLQVTTMVLEKFGIQHRKKTSQPLATAKYVYLLSINFLAVLSSETRKNYIN